MASKFSCTLSSVASSISRGSQILRAACFLSGDRFLQMRKNAFFQPRAFGFCKNSAGSTLCLDFRRPASCDLEYRACFGAGLVAKVLFKKVKIYCRKLGDMEENKLFLCEIVVKIWDLSDNSNLENLIYNLQKYNQFCLRVFYLTCSWQNKGHDEFRIHFLEHDAWEHFLGHPAGRKWGNCIRMHVALSSFNCDRLG